MGIENLQKSLKITIKFLGIRYFEWLEQSKRSDMLVAGLQPKNERGFKVINKRRAIINQDKKIIR
jgi:hypothetical protein